MSNHNDDIQYSIDKNDCLVDLNDNWDLFAVENGSDNLNKSAVYGIPIWNFISGDETKYVHQVLLKRVKSKGSIKNLAFRCDSPECKRFMAMDISCKEDGLITFRCKLIKTEARNLPSFSSNSGNNKHFIRMCSWCNKIDIGQEEWVEIEDAVNRLELLEKDQLPAFTHTMCNVCMARLEADDD